jgi:dTMP kinase
MAIDKGVKGIFITFEGPEGSGKTTQVALVKDYLWRQSIPCMAVGDPGGTAIGDRIRQMLLDPGACEMRERTELLLYAASRAQLVEQVIQPALANGLVVLCDRYVDSSLAYQGYGALWDIDEVGLVNQIATGGLQPDRTYLFDISVELGQDRLQARGIQRDRIELKEHIFHARVRAGYLKIAEGEPERYRQISADQSIADIFQQIQIDLVDLLDVWQRLDHVCKEI